MIGNINIEILLIIIVVFTSLLLILMYFLSKDEKNANKKKLITKAFQDILFEELSDILPFKEEDVIDIFLLNNQQIEIVVFDKQEKRYVLTLKRTYD